VWDRIPSRSTNKAKVLNGIDKAFQWQESSTEWCARLLVVQTRQPMGGKKCFPKPSSWNDRPPWNFPFFDADKDSKKRNGETTTPLRNSRTRVETWADSIVELFECQQLIIYLSHRESPASERRKKAEPCMQLSRGTAQRNFPDRFIASWLAAVYGVVEGARWDFPLASSSDAFAVSPIFR
jgi:hypothetical protein